MEPRSLPEQSRQAVQDLIALLYADTPLRVVEQRACERAREMLDVDCIFIGIAHVAAGDAMLNCCRDGTAAFDPKPLIDRAISTRQRAFAVNGTRGVAVPILYGDTVLGAVAAFDSRRTRFFDADADMLEAFGQYIAIARTNHEKLRHLLGTLRWERQASWLLIVVAILACIALGTYGYFLTHSNQTRVFNNARVTADRSSDNLDRYVASGSQLASTTAAVAPEYRGNRAGTEAFLKKILDSAKTTVIYGVGLWYEPYKFSPALKLYGPYVHRASAGRTVLTYMWSHVNYNYVQHAWYKKGLAARTRTLITSPYFDTDHVYISAVHDVRANGQSIGVVSVDTTSEAVNGYLTRMVTRDDLAYLTTLTGRVVGFPHADDLLAFARTRHPAKNVFDATEADAQAYIAQRYPGERVAVRTRASHIPVMLINSMSASSLGSMRPSIMMFVLIAALIWLFTFAAILAIRQARTRGATALDLHRERTRLALEVNAHVNAEEALRKAAEYDALTGLANRATMLTAIDHSIEGARLGAAHDSLLFVDLNSFERVNITFGHAAGDKILEEFAALLRKCAGENDTPGRIGGDEFAVLVHGDTQRARAVGECVHHGLEQALVLEDESVYLDAGIGVVEILGSYESAEDVIRDADFALYQAKVQPRSGVVEFDPALREEAAKQRELQAALRGAIARGEMFVEYQPICRICNGELMGFEALVRWRRDGQPVLYPNEFIPLAERTGLVCQVDRFVAEVASDKMAQWQRVHPELRLELNASALHFEHPGALRGLTNVLLRNPLRPQTLDIELTESSLMGLTDEAVNAVRDLHGLGIRLHLDDFGTGYSSFTYLQYLQVDALKIDRSFVETMLSDERAMRIVRAIVNLAMSMEVEVIAEGVQTHEQARALEKLGVTLGQGYLYAHPMPADEAERMIEQRYLAQQR